MRAITSKDGDLLSIFDNINEETGADGATTRDNITSTSLIKMLFENHQAMKKVKIRGQIPLEHKIGICKTFEKVSKNLEFHFTLKKLVYNV